MGELEPARTVMQQAQEIGSPEVAEHAREALRMLADG